VRISVIGNSDTTGMLLGPGGTSWPVLVQHTLAESTQDDVTLDSWRFAPYRPDALEYILRLVDAADPDVVVMTLPGYWCSFSTVQFSVQHRFGERVARWYLRAEKLFTGRIDGPAGMASRRNRLVRRAARRVLGARALLTVEQNEEIFTSIIRELGTREGLRVVVLGDHHFSAALRGVMPGIAQNLGRIDSTFHPLVVERRMAWGDLERMMVETGRHDELLMGDGVHMTQEAHELAARMVARLVASGPGEA